jgi:hypothetical protein
VAGIGGEVPPPAAMKRLTASVTGCQGTSHGPPRPPPACTSSCIRFFTTFTGYPLLAGLGRRTIPTRRTMPMDAPVEELGAPAEPLGPSGAPDLGAPSSRSVPTSSGRNGGLRAAQPAGDAFARLAMRAPVRGAVSARPSGPGRCSQSINDGKAQRRPCSGASVPSSRMSVFEEKSGT